MIDRRLIEQIAAEVVKKLLAAEANPIKQRKHNLLMVGDPSSLESSLLNALEAKWHVIQFSSLEDIELHTIMKVVFLETSQDLLVKGALGICDTLESELLSVCILNKVQVSLIPKNYLKQYLLGEKNTNQEYLSQLMSYKEKLLKFGVEIDTLKSIADDSNKVTSADKMKEKAKRKLITQRDVLKYPINQIMVDQQTIITPLARDKARELGKSIKVIETKGAEESCKWGQ